MRFWLERLDRLVATLFRQRGQKPGQLGGEVLVALVLEPLAPPSYSDQPSSSIAAWTSLESTASLLSAKAQSSAVSQSVLISLGTPPE